MDLAEIVGIIAGILTTLGVLPQIIKAVRTGQAEDVSPYMFLILCVGVGLWTVYGVMKMDWPIIITNGVSFLLNGIMLYIVIASAKRLK